MVVNYLTLDPNHVIAIKEKTTYLIHIIYIQISGEGVSRFASYQLHYIIVMIPSHDVTTPSTAPLLASSFTAFLYHPTCLPWRRGLGCRDGYLEERAEH